MTAFTTFGGAGAVGKLAEHGLTSLAASSVPKVAELGGAGLRGLQGLRSLASSAREMGATVGEAGSNLLGGTGLGGVMNIGTINEMKMIAGKGLDAARTGIRAVREDGVRTAALEAGVLGEMALRQGGRHLGEALRSVRHPIDTLKTVGRDVRPMAGEAWQELRHGEGSIKVRVAQSVDKLRPAIERIKQEPIYKPAVIGSKIGTVVGMPGLFLGRLAESSLERFGKAPIKIFKRGFYAQRQAEQRQRIAELTQLGLSPEEARRAAGSA
jgi:hypothetical protein